MQGYLSSYGKNWKHPAGFAVGHRRATAMTTTPPAALSNVGEALVTALGDAVSTAPERLDAFVADTYWPALHAAAAGAPIARPDVVVRPRTEEDVATVVAIGHEHRVPVVAWGGGSGTQGGALPIRGG